MKELYLNRFLNSFYGTFLLIPFYSSIATNKFNENAAMANYELISTKTVRIKRRLICLRKQLD